MIYDKLVDFLKQYPKTGNGKHTHTIYGGENGGSYTIPTDQLETFYKLVHRAIFVKKNQFSIVEKVQPTCRLVIDLDFKYKEKQETRQYNQNVIKDFINQTFQHISNLYEITDDKKVCFVMEKDNHLDAPQTNYKSKDGIHLLFPYIIAGKDTYLKLRESLLNIDLKEIFVKESFNPPSNSNQEIIDENIYKGGNWFIYGSGKPNEINYKLTNIYKQQDNSIIKLSSKLYEEETLELVKLNSVSLMEQNVGYTNELTSQLKKKKLKSSSSSESVDILDFSNPSVVLSKTQKYDNDTARKLIDCLSVERASNCKDWIDVGYCLHSINSKTMLPYWISFSKKWPMYVNEQECNKQWEYMNNTNNRQYTIASLHYWARKDNEQLYEKIKKDSLEKFINTSIKGQKQTGPHADVANVIYHYFKDIFVCGNIKDNIWYYFNESLGGKWELTEQGHILRSSLSREIVDLYMYYQHKYQQQTKDLDEEDEMYQILNNRTVNISKVIIKLKDSSYKDKIMKECREFFYDKAFMEKLNDKKNLIGFENGIYNLETSEFREGLPEDFVSLSCGLVLPVTKENLPITINDLKEEIKSINHYEEMSHGLNDFLEKVFPIPSVRVYTLRFLSSCLSGEVREEKFYFWTGSGGNGKSKLIELMDFSFGDYSRSMDVSYLTTKRGSSSSASPELENIRNARFVSMSEPEKTDQIYVGKLKQMTGGDKMTSRGLFKETTQFKPQFKMVLMCNDLPKLAGNDGGIWRRIEVVKYIAKFTDNPQPSPANPHQFLADEQLSSKLDEWKLLFMIMLMDKYLVYNEKGTQPPVEVTKETKMYRVANDIIQNWISDDLEPCDEMSDFDTLHSLWEKWCDEEGFIMQNNDQRKRSQRCFVEVSRENRLWFGSW